MPVTIEALGAIGPISLAILKDLETRLWQLTKEESAGQYLLQQLTGAVQRGNSISVRGFVGGLPNNIKRYNSTS